MNPTPIETTAAIFVGRDPKVVDGGDRRTMDFVSSTQHNNTEQTFRSLDLQFASNGVLSNSFPTLTNNKPATTTILNNNFMIQQHSGGNLPFATMPPPSHFFSMLSSNGTEHPIPKSNIQSTSSCNLFIPANHHHDANVFTPSANNGGRVSSPSSPARSSSNTSGRSSSLVQSRPPTTTLDAPASVLLQEPPSLSTIIDDHHPTIPTSDIYTRNTSNDCPKKITRGSKVHQQRATASVLEDIDDDRGAVATLVMQNRQNMQSRQLYIDQQPQTCEDDCMCGCEEDKVESELRLQDKFFTYLNWKDLNPKKRPATSDFESHSESDYSSEEGHNSVQSRQTISENIAQLRKKRKKRLSIESIGCLVELFQMLHPDCVLYIFQFLNFSGKDCWFTNIKNMYGRFKKTQQVTPLYKYITIRQCGPLRLTSDKQLESNIISLTIDRHTNMPLECENGYLSNVENSLKTLVYFNYSNNSTTSKRPENEIEIGETGNKETEYFSSEDEMEGISSFELVEDENDHIIGLKRKSQSEGNCFLREVYRSCKSLEKLKIVDMNSYVPFKVSMKLSKSTRAIEKDLAFVHSLKKLRLCNCLLPSYTLQAISQLKSLESIHLENTFVADPTQYDCILKLQSLKRLKVQVVELPETFYKLLVTAFPSLEKLYLNVLNQTSLRDQLEVDKLPTLQSLSLISHFKVDLLSMMKKCTNLKHLRLGFDVCFNHIFPNEMLTSCVLRNVFISPDRSNVLVRNQTLRTLKLSPASIKAAQKELTYIKNQRESQNKPFLSITEY